MPRGIDFRFSESRRPKHWSTPGSTPRPSPKVSPEYVEAGGQSTSMFEQPADGHKEDYQ